MRRSLAGIIAMSVGAAVGVGLDGRIAGAEIVEHHEPILVIGITDVELAVAPVARAPALLRAFGCVSARLSLADGREIALSV